MASLDLRGLRDHAVRIRALRYDADRSRHPGREVRATILDEAKVGARLLDQNRAAAVPGGQFDHLAPEIGVLDPAPERHRSGNNLAQETPRASASACHARLFSG